MPFTFLSHQAVVLPFKIARPAWWNGTALVFGSMAPDVEYFLRGEPYSAYGHSLLGQLTFCLPVTLLLVLVFRGIFAGPVGAHFPATGFPSLASIPRTWRYWLLAVPSALVGSGSHVLWDGFTHREGIVARRWDLLRETAFTIGGHPVPVCRVLQHGSTLAGGVATIVLLGWIVRRTSLLSRGAVAFAPTRATWIALLVPTAVGLLAGATLGALRGGDVARLAVVSFLRATTLGTFGLAFGCVLSEHLARARRPLSEPLPAAP
jgi:hypothetical protein